MTSALPRTAPQESKNLKGKNQRTANRYAVRTSLQYRVSGGRFSSTWKSGRSLDMSVSGILVDLPEAVPAGATMELAIDWLSLYHGRPTTLFVTGSVVRNDDNGTALRILSAEFREVRTVPIRSRRTARHLAVAS